MSSESLSVNYEMATVLFIDIVGYSMQPIDRQMEILSTLQTVVKESVSYQRAQADKELIAIPSGDGMALVFLRSPVMPVRCGLEIAGALRAHPEVHLRMGVHTGPICRHEDIKESINIVGGGINIAQRVMDSGDAGHILLSHTVAEVLRQFSGWSDSLRDLGEHEVKHGLRIHLHNLFKDGLGNPEIPSCMRREEPVLAPAPIAPVEPTPDPAEAPVRKRNPWKWLLAGSLAGVAILAVGAFLIQQKGGGLFSAAVVSPKSPVQNFVPPGSANPAAAASTPPVPADAMRLIDEWAASTKAMDLNRHMAVYADSLDAFYNKKQIPKADVAKNVQSMFDQEASFDDLRFDKWASRELPQGRLLVEFDKQFKATMKTGVPNEGMVHSQLVLEKFGDAWKIVSEADTKVYWTNKAERDAVASSAQALAATPPPSDKDALSETATYRDPNSYIEFRYPSRILHQEAAANPQEVIRLKSDEGVVISVMIVPGEGTEALAKAYQADIAMPSREIQYKTPPRNGWYVVSGYDGPAIFYRRVVSTRGHVASITFVHEKSLTPRYNFAPMIAPTFRAVE